MLTRAFSGGRIVAGFVVLLSLSSTAFAGGVTLNSSDVLGTTSFNTAGQWSNSAAPSAGNTYLVPGGITLRTPATGLNYTFAGDSLTLGDGTTIATMAYKATGNNSITINNLTLNNGALGNANGNTFTLAGNGVNMLSGGGVMDTDANARIITIAEALTGVGRLTINNSGGSGQGTVNLTTADSYSGGTTINSFVLLDVLSDGGLGTGSVTVNSGGTLTLTGGTTNSYIASTASLIVGSGTGSINLTFTGTDAISALSLNGGTTFLASGTYGSLTSTAQNKNAIFTGNGILSVGGAASTPEPPTLALLGGTLLVPGALRRRERRGKA